MDVGAWLGRLGLQQYAEVFAENRIDAEVLEQLTAEDLKELGVTALGDRRRLLTAIESLREGERVRVSSGEQRRPGDAQTGSAAERRHLTALFCDLVDSTALSASLDPEDYQEIIRRYRSVITDAAGSQGGFVAQYRGDGALIYFGFPAAHEDDAERALRTALLLRDRAQEIQVNGASLQVRAGLATGLVVVGERAEGTKASEPPRIIGETPDLATRLQSLAEPGGIVIDAATSRLVGRMFELSERAATTLKGIERPVQCWNVLGEARVESRFEALRSGETPLFGRDEELELLERRWQQAKDGSGRIIMISGEAGLGKSRLVSAFRERIGEDHPTELRFFCSPQHTTTALYPVTAHVTRAANLSSSDAPGQKIEKLAALFTNPDDLPFIADLLSLPVNPSARLEDFAPQEKRQKVFTALLRRVEELAQDKALFLFFEDLHWIDPTTLELMDILISGISRKPVLVIVTFRPQFRPPWTGQANVSTVALNRLLPEDRAALIQALAGNIGLSREMIDEIAERTDGIPLFAEELTKAVLESSNAELLKTTSAVGSEVPATLHASLMARLDHLGSVARETAQVGSVIGREFSYDRLVALVAQSRVLPLDVVDPALGALVDSGLVFVRGTPPSASYTFKHALVQDAAHSTLLRTQRQKLHAVLASILEADEKVAPEVVAYHLGEAGEYEKAAREWLRAALWANEQSAVREALQNLDEATRSLLLLPRTTASQTLQLQVETARIFPTMMTAGFGSKEVGAVLDRAETIAAELGADKPILLLFHRSMSSLSRSDFNTGLPLALEFLHRADPEVSMVAHRVCSSCFMPLGRLREALSHFEAVIAEDAARSAKLRFAFVSDPHALTLINMALTLLLLGLPEDAERTRERALEREKLLAHPPTTAWVVAMGLLYAILIDDRNLMEVLSPRMFQQVQKFKVPHFERVARMNVAYLTALKGDPGAGLTEIDACLAEWLAVGYRYLLPLAWIVKIRIQLLINDKIESALETVKVGLAHVAETDEAMLAAELHRLHGVVALASQREGNERLAEQAFETAIAVARSQEAKWLELRAATSLARLWRDQGRHEEAERLLAPVYNWFTQGLNTPDLLEAKALLDELSTTSHAAA